MDINFSKANPASSIARVAVKNRGSLIELIILVMVGVLFFWFILLPKKSELGAKREVLKAFQEQSANLAEQQEKLDILIRQLDKNDGEITKLDESLPLHGRVTWMYLLVEGMIASSGMNMGNLSVEAPDIGVVAGDRALIADRFSATRQIKKMNVNLSLTGSPAQFEAFLKKLENNARIMDVKVMEITGSQNQLLDFRLSFEAYYFGPLAQ